MWKQKDEETAKIAKEKDEEHAEVVEELSKLKT